MLYSSLHLFWQQPHLRIRKSVQAAVLVSKDFSSCSEQRYPLYAAPEGISGTGKARKQARVCGTYTGSGLARLSLSLNPCLRPAALPPLDPGCGAAGTIRAGGSRHIPSGGQPAHPGCGAAGTSWARCGRHIPNAAHPERAARRLPCSRSPAGGAGAAPRPSPSPAAGPPRPCRPPGVRGPPPPPPNFVRGERRCGPAAREGRAAGAEPGGGAGTAAPLRSEGSAPRPALPWHSGSRDSSRPCLARLLGARGR